MIAAALLAFSHWKYERTIAAPHHRATVAIAVPASIYANAQPTLDDLRVIDERGELVPFAILQPQTGETQRWVDARLTDEGFVAGRYSQVVADLGARPGTYGLLEIATPLDAFATNVDVDASDDGTTWRTIRTGAPIYDYERDGLATNTRVTFPASTARYLRIRILDERSPFPVDGVRVAAPIARAPESTRYQIVIRASTDAQTSTYLFAGVDEVPIDRVQVDTATPRFARAVLLQSSDDGTGWSTVASSDISRIRPSERLSFDFDEAQARQWRLIVENGDDPPLANVRIAAFGVPRRLIFDASPSHAYFLIYGNPAAASAAFDYAATHSESALASAPYVALGPPRQNAAFAPVRKPWTDRHPWVLWIALALAVVVIGGVATRTFVDRKHST